MEMLKFWLVNNEGCEMKGVTATNFRNARKELQQWFAGKYKIVWTDKWGVHNEKNVRL